MNADGFTVGAPPGRRMPEGERDKTGQRIEYEGQFPLMLSVMSLVIDMNRGLL